MKRFEKILFYYSILAITVLFFTSVFYSPKPLNFVSLGLLLPLLAYFWIKLTSPDKTSQNNWNKRILGVIVVLSALAIFTASFAAKEPVPAKTSSNVNQDPNLSEIKSEIEALQGQGLSTNDIAQELAGIKQEISNLKTAKDKIQTSDTLGTSTSSSDLSTVSSLADIHYGKLTIKSSTIKTLDVLQDPAFSSRRVAEIKYGTNYEFFDKQGDWYLVKASDGTLGYVNTRDVQEITSK